MKKGKTLITISYDNPHFKKGKSKTIFTVCGIEGFMPSRGNRTRKQYSKLPPKLQRTFGWYSNLKDACKDVKNNMGELWEYAYDYIVIEEVKEGVWGMAIKEWWFKWNRKKKAFFSIRKPKETISIVNWGIG